MQPARGAVWRSLQQGFSDPQAFFPTLFLRGNQPPEFEHIRLVLLGRADLAQLDRSLGGIAQFQPSDGGGEMVRVWRLECLHHG